MIKKIITGLAFLAALVVTAQNETAIADIKKFQAELNAEYKSPEKSPMDPKDRKKFKKHEFFDVDLKYRVVAKLDRNVDQGIFQMKTSTTRVAKYKKYALAKFQLDGQDYELTLYQSMDLTKSDEYKDY